MSPLTLPRLGSRRRAVALAFRREELLARTSDGRWVRRRLPGDFLNASPTEPNLGSAVEAARAVQSALAEFGSPDRRFADAVIALPDRAAHAVFSEVAGPRAVRRLRSELVRGLTGGSGGAGGSELAGRDRDGRFRFGVLASGPRRRRSALGAVSGAAVVQQYEAAAEAAGLRVRWVDATSLAVLPEWLAAGNGTVEARFLLLLHRRHFVLASAAGRRLAGFRLKLRAALDPDPPTLAVLQAEGSRGRPVEVWGDGAEAVVEALDRAGGEVRATGRAPGADGVSPVTDRALAALLRRLGERPAPLHPTSIAPGETR